MGMEITIEEKESFPDKGSQVREEIKPSNEEYTYNLNYNANPQDIYTEITPTSNEEYINNLNYNKNPQDIYEEITPTSNEEYINNLNYNTNPQDIYAEINPTSISSVQVVDNQNAFPTNTITETEILPATNNQPEIYNNLEENIETKNYIENLIPQTGNYSLGYVETNQESNYLENTDLDQYIQNPSETPQFINSNEYTEQPNEIENSPENQMIENTGTQIVDEIPELSHYQQPNEIVPQTIYEEPNMLEYTETNNPQPLYESEQNLNCYDPYNNYENSPEVILIGDDEDKYCCPFPKFLKKLFS